MPKVLRIINRLNIGGPTFNAAYLTRYLAPEFETILLAGQKDDSEGSSQYILDELGIQPRYITDMKREISISHDRKAYAEIDKIIKNFKPDIVHTHAAKSGTLGRLAAWRNNVPVIVHTFHGHVFHSYFSPLKTKIFIGIERFLASRSSAIIAISEKQKYELGTVYKITNPDKIKVVPLGFDLTKFSENQEAKRIRFREKYNVDADTITVGIIGRLVPVKNHTIFIYAWKNLLKQTNKKIHGFIVGDGEDFKKITELCDREGILYNTVSRNIPGATLTFTSWITDIDRVNAGVDIIALTSDNEGTPVSLIEAMAAGKPVVSTDTGGISDVVLEGKTGLLSLPGDIESFTANLVKLVEDSGLRNRFALEGPAQAMRFGYMRLVDEMRNLYHELLITRG